LDNIVEYVVMQNYDWGCANIEISCEIRQNFIL